MKKNKGRKNGSDKNEDDDEDDEDENVTKKPKLVSKIPDATDATDLVDRLVARYGTERAALATLADENFQYRTRHRDDTARIEELEPNVVTKEEKESLTKYKTLGTVEELTTIKTEFPKLKDKVTEVDRKTLHSEAAEAAGYENADILADLSKTKNFTIEVRSEGSGDEKKKVAYAKGPEENATFSPLTEFVEKNYKGYIPSLMNAGEETGSGGKGTPVVKVPRQVGNNKSKAPKTNPAQAYLGATYKTPGQVKKQNSNA